MKVELNSVSIFCDIFVCNHNVTFFFHLQANLRSAAYEAIMEMVKNSPSDCYAAVQKTTMIILEKLNHVLQMEGHITSQNDR